MKKKQITVSQLKERFGPHLKIDLGCGQMLDPGWLGIDIQGFKNPDIIQHDMQTFPWPVPSNAFRIAKASDIVEHINPANGGFLKWMDEVWRILEPDGQLMIAMPYGVNTGFVQDPTHCNPCNEHTWRYFDPLDYSKFYYFYRPKPWKIQKVNYEQQGYMEAVLIKRRMDKSYE